MKQGDQKVEMNNYGLVRRSGGKERGRKREGRRETKKRTRVDIKSTKGF